MNIKATTINFIMLLNLALANFVWLVNDIQEVGLTYKLCIVGGLLVTDLCLALFYFYLVNFRGHKDD